MGESDLAIQDLTMRLNGVERVSIFLARCLTVLAALAVVGGGTLIYLFN